MASLSLQYLTSISKLNQRGGGEKKWSSPVLNTRSTNIVSFDGSIHRHDVGNVDVPCTGGNDERADVPN